MKVTKEFKAKAQVTNWQSLPRQIRFKQYDQCCRTLWNALLHSTSSGIWSREYKIGDLRVDYYHSSGVAIELNGGSHHNNSFYGTRQSDNKVRLFPARADIDAMRDAYLTISGVTVYQLTEAQVTNQAVLAHHINAIQQLIAKRLNHQASGRKPCALTGRNRRTPP